MKNLNKYFELTKVRLTLMSLLTVAISFVLASEGGVQKMVLAWTLLGAGLLGAGVNAINQWMEYEIDARMKRTSQRPIPRGDISLKNAFFTGSFLTLAGISILFLFGGVLSGVLAVATGMSYVFLYTPLKQKSELNTFVGAIPGSLPVLIGWTAAGAAIDVRACSLLAILYFWQLPHFFAIAWMFREDYEIAGFRMVSHSDELAQKTSSHVLIWSPILFLSTFFPVFAGLSGSLYFSAAFISGIFFLALALYTGTHQMRNAKAFMVSSIVYLGALNCFLLMDKV